MASKTFNLTIDADVSGALENIEKLKGALEDPNNALRSISTLAKQASVGLRGFEDNIGDIDDKFLNAINDLGPALQLTKEGATVASGKMKGLEEALKGVAKAQEILSKTGFGGSETFGNISKLGDEWAKEYRKIVAEMEAAKVKPSVSEMASQRAMEALIHSDRMFGYGPADSDALFSGTSLYTKELSGEIGALQGALKKLYETGSGNTELISSLNSRIKELGTISKMTSTSLSSVFQKMKQNIMAYSTTMFFGKAVHGLLSGVPKLIRQCSQAASDAAEANNLYYATFDKIKESAASASGEIQSSFALAESTANNAIGTFGQYMVGLGKSQGEALEFAKKATSVFLDLRSFKNIGGDLNTFMQKAMSGLAGNTENFRTMGLAISAAAAQERLMKKGLGDLTGEAKRAAFAQEYLEMVIEQSADAMGDFQRNYHSMQNTTQRLQEQSKKFRENVGEGINSWLTPMRSLIADMYELNNVMAAAKENAEALFANGEKGWSNGDMDRQRKLVGTAFGTSYTSLRPKVRSELIKSGDYTSEENVNAEARKRALELVSQQMNMQAVEVVKLTRLNETYGESLLQVAEAIDEQTAARKELESIGSKTESAKSAAAGIQEVLSGVLQTLDHGMEGTLSAYQRNTGDYDTKSALQSYRDALVEAYNTAASQKAVAWAGFADSETPTEGKMAYLAQFNAAREAMVSLVSAIASVDDELAGLGQTVKEVSDEALGLNVREFASNLGADLERTRYADSLGDSPYKDAELSRYDNERELASLIETVRSLGELAEDEIASLDQVARKAIAETYDYQKKQALAALEEEYGGLRGELSDAQGNIGRESSSIRARLKVATGKERNNPFQDAADEYAASMAQLAKDSAEWTAKYGVAKSAELEAEWQAVYAQQRINSELEAITGLDWSGLSEVIKNAASPEVRQMAKELRVSSLSSYAKSQAMGLATSSGVGDVVQGAAQGAAAGGPWGAILGAVLAILEKTEAFETVGEVMEQVLDVVNDFLEPTLPLIKAINEFTQLILYRIMAPLYEPFKMVVKCVSYISAACGTLILIGQAINDTIVLTGNNIVQGWKNLKRNANPWNWITGNTVSWDHDMDWNYGGIWSDAMGDIAHLWDENSKIQKTLDDAVFDLDAIKDNTSNTDKLDAWKEMMNAGYLTGEQFSALSKQYYGVGYSLGSRSFTASNYGAFAGTSKSVTIGQISITIEGTGDPEAVAKKVEQILRNKAVYGASA